MPKEVIRAAERLSYRNLLGYDDREPTSSDVKYTAMPGLL